MSLKIFSKEFNSHYAFHPLQPELSTWEKVKATVTSAALLIFTFGLYHTICYSKYHDRAIKLMPKDNSATTNIEQVSAPIFNQLPMAQNNNLIWRDVTYNKHQQHNPLHQNFAYPAPAQNLEMPPIIHIPLEMPPIIHIPIDSPQVPLDSTQMIGTTTSTTLSNQFPKIKVGDPALESYFSILDKADTIQAIKYITEFETKSELKVLWAYAEALQPHKDTVDQQINDVIALSSHPLVIQNPKLNQVFNSLLTTLLSYQEEPSPFNKIPGTLSKELKSELRNYERAELMKFYAHLSVITTNGETNSIALTSGLSKLREYIAERKHQLDMRLGVSGVAELIFLECKNNFFVNRAQENRMTEVIQDGEPVAIAKMINTGGHFVTELQVSGSELLIDSIGRRKVVPNSDALAIAGPNGSVDEVTIGSNFLKIGVPLEVKDICVPYQNQNNCYMVSGWLTFNAYMHYLRQTVIA